MSKDLVYAPKSSIDIHISITPKKKRVWIVDPWHVQQVEPQTLVVEKIIMEKIIMEKIIMEKPVNLP